MQQKTKTYYLEMLDRHSFSPKSGGSGLQVILVSPPDPEINHRFYCEVGSQWKWIDRLGWSDDKWKEYACRDSIQTWLGKLNGKDIGYFELDSQGDGNVEIALFGLLPEFIGKGLGGIFLSRCIQCAWDIPGTQRIWLHTCTLDHEYALDNYLKRGFKLYKTEGNQLVQQQLRNEDKESFQ